MRDDHARGAAIENPRNIGGIRPGDPPQHRQTGGKSRRRHLPELSQTDGPVLHVGDDEIESRPRVMRTASARPKTQKASP